MAKFAPEIPTTHELRTEYASLFDQQTGTTTMRERVSSLLARRSTELLAIVGPCAMTLDEDIIYDEGARLATLTAESSDITALHRLPPWKPRTRAEDWHGLETTEPEAAYRILAACAFANANLAIEMGDSSHLTRYSDLVALAWRGARSCENQELTTSLALHDPALPVAIKNDLTGELDGAIGHADAIARMRNFAGANTTLLFRGGESAQNPDDWEQLLLRAYDRSDNVIVDVAHGGEMAHDPEQNFKKSVPGQVACLDHLIQIAEQTGKTPTGVMIEASDASSPTDPVMPFEQAIEGVEHLAAIKRAA